MNTYQLEKSIWTLDDFEQMGWHDCYIHAVSMTEDGEEEEYELLLDIDYIFDWVLNKEKKTYSFWIAPATLVFRNVYGIDLSADSPSMEIDDIIYDNPRVPNNAEHIKVRTEYDWNIQLHKGN